MFNKEVAYSLINMSFSVITNLLGVYIYIGIGFLLGMLLKSHRVPIQKITTQFLINIITPIQIFLIMGTTQFSLTGSFIIRVMGLALSTYIIQSFIVTSFFRWKKYDTPQLGSVLLTSIYPNVIYYVLPIILANFHEDLVILPVLYVVVTVSAKSIFLPLQAHRLGTNSKMDMKKLVKQSILFPPFIGLVIAGIFMGFHLPLPVSFLIAIKSPINTLSSIIAAILLGFILAGVNFSEFRKMHKPILYVALWRFLLSFLIFMSSLFYLKFPESQSDIRTILLIISCAPPAVNNIVFAVFFDFDEKLTASTIATLTFFSLAILPLLLVVGANFL